MKIISDFTILYYKYEVFGVFLLLFSDCLHQRVQALSVCFSRSVITTFSLTNIPKPNDNILLHSHHFSYLLRCSSSSTSNQSDNLPKSSTLDENDSYNTNKTLQQKSLNLDETSRIQSLPPWPQSFNFTVLINQDLFQSINQTQKTILSFIDLIQNGGGENNSLVQNNQRLQKRDLIRLILRKAASLSLKDYEWRSSFFRTAEAERRVQESLARLMGEEYATYIRPGDAPETKIGPLGTY
jgi:hypothetical protein